MSEYIIQVHEIKKEYPGVVALKDISFSIRKNSIHCIVGENGAGKSTFIKILTGAVERSAGKILMEDVEYNPNSIRGAIRAGISVLFQELNVVDDLTVQENLILGHEQTRFGVIQKSDRYHKVYDTLKLLDPSIQLRQKVSELTHAKKQMIEIAKAIATDARVIVMDEPTAALSKEEVRKLSQIIKNLHKQNITVIYISHRLEEIFDLGDEVTVFRDGQVITTLPMAEVGGQDELIRHMLGKVVVQQYTPNHFEADDKVLEIQGLRNKKLKGINFSLRRGEIIGFYGLVGAGKTEIARSIFGADGKEGEVVVSGKTVRINSPQQAIRAGIAMVPEERRTEGLVTSHSIRENITMMNIKKILRNGVISSRRDREIALEYIRKTGIATHSEEKQVSLLSGGNQQKVVVSKCLNAESSILLLDEPTRGVDIGAKEEIYSIIRDLSKSGTSSIVFSSELPEILNLCDRIFILYEGELREELANGPDIDSEYVMKIATGGIAE